MKIKALSIKQPWASMIQDGTKTIETRKWVTDYRGDILVVSSKQPELPGLPVGQALAVATLTDCRPMTQDDKQAACCDIYDGAYSWILGNIRPIKPSPVYGRPGIYEVKVEPEQIAAFAVRGELPPLLGTGR